MKKHSEGALLRRYFLRRGEIILGGLSTYDYDFPWDRAHFTPSPDFDAVRPLFERERTLSETPYPEDDEGQARHFDELEDARERIAGLHLEIEHVSSGQRFHGFDLWIHGDKAEFKLRRKA
jgi:hypothetical protein